MSRYAGDYEGSLVEKMNGRHLPCLAVVIIPLSNGIVFLGSD